MIIVSVFLFHAVLRLKLENLIMGGWSKAGVYFGNFKNHDPFNMSPFGF